MGTNTKYNWKDKNCLIVEDTHSNFVLLKYLLSNTEINLMHAQNGEKAIEIFKSCNNIDIVLMDIKLPKMNGIETTQKIKNHNCNVPVIAQTAYATFGDKEIILNSGFDDYISKPIKHHDILNKINKQLQR